MTKKTSPLQRLRDGPPREKREHPGEPPPTSDPHPRASAAPMRLSAPAMPR